MVSKEKTSVTSIDITKIAICVANILHDYLIMEQQLTRTMDINNGRKQDSKSSHIKAGLYLLETINDGTGKVKSGEYREAI
ncbi:MAG: hypothetical protein ACEY3K_03525 [Wolbachia sp.]